MFSVLVHFSAQGQIDRREVLSRHSIIHTEADPLNPLTVGNGKFAFTADITGLQSFPGAYEQGIPLGTMAEWAWHSFPNPNDYSLEDVIRYYPVGQDSVPYYFQFSDDKDSGKNEATTWLRENPHRLHLGLIGLEMIKKDGSKGKLSDIRNPRQQLNLWTGELTSRFEIEGLPVEVITLCHQQLDMISVRIESPLIEEGRLLVSIHFPYGTHEKFSPGYDFARPEVHTSRVIDQKSEWAIIERTLDKDRYYARIQASDRLLIKEEGRHQFLIQPEQHSNNFEFEVLFSEKMTLGLFPDFEQTRVNNQISWEQFWESGGAIDFSGSINPLAGELERRVILSQYLTRVQCTGFLPPQETGLTFNSWHGKFHLEMHWWHMVHFMLWGRQELIKPQLEYYRKIESQAAEVAAWQGYEGVRWPKMTDPEGRESPSSIGVFLIWQQPHFIYYVDLLYRLSGGDPEILNTYSDLVFKTARFMASYARLDSMSDSYVLGPALIPAQERFDPETTLNPAFELAYWHWGLEAAQQWREQLGLQRDSSWQTVLDKLPPLAAKDSLYLFTEDALDSYTNPVYLTDHPMVLGILGFLPPTKLVDNEIMRNTLKAIEGKWNWESCWGWDFPMACMNAASLGEYTLALKLLLMDNPKNNYLSNGHNYQNQSLSLYLPGNGALLTAVAFLCALEEKFPGEVFPAEDGWKVKSEKLSAPW
ncbi:MAG: hypothetical protein JW801_12535 [Bacteroidales bacterium]|nr:hypothetical protein [Bacteroidales bacterium]